MKALLEAGADVNITTHDAYTSSKHSSVAGQEVCVKSLIKVGANVNTLNSRGGLALVLASHKQSVSGYSVNLELM